MDTTKALVIAIVGLISVLLLLYRFFVDTRSLAERFDDKLRGAGPSIFF